jgi:hypothetical protein
MRPDGMKERGELPDLTAFTLAAGHVGVQVGEIALQDRPVDAGQAGDADASQNRANLVRAPSPRRAASNPRPVASRQRSHRLASSLITGCGMPPNRRVWSPANPRRRRRQVSRG